MGLRATVAGRFSWQEAESLAIQAFWLREGVKYAIKHTTRWGRAMVTELQYRLDVNTLHRDETSHGLGLNEIGRIRLRTTTPFFFDEYRRNRTTGSFILVDEGSNVTIGAGMITGEAS